MSWGFKKSFKVAPGLKINLNKRSASVRVGPKNAGITVGTKGAHASASAPGTGLSVRTKIAGNKRAAQAGHVDNEAMPLELAKMQQDKPVSAFGRFLYRLSGVLFILTALIAVVGLVMD